MSWFWIVATIVIISLVAGWLTRHRSGRRDLGGRIDHARGVNEGRSGTYRPL